MIKQLIDLGLKKGLKTIEVNSVKKIGLDIKVYDGKLDKCTKSIVDIYTVRGLYRGHQSSITIENLDPNKLESYIDSLIMSAKIITSKEPVVFYKGAKKYKEVVQKTSDLDSYSIEEKQNKLLKLEHIIKSDRLCKTVESTNYSESFVRTILANSMGLYLEKNVGHAIMYSIGVFEKDTDIQSALDYKIGFNFADFDESKIAKNIVKEGKSKLGGIQIETGNYEVVLSNEAFSSLLSAFSDVFSSESVVRNMTKLKDKLGAQIASPLINFTDDPFSKHALVQEAFDSEGYPTRKKDIIKDGIFKGFINNLKYAKMLGQKPTGNSFGGVNFVQPEIKAGKTKLNDLFSKIGTGLFITELAGLHASVNPTSGSFQAQASGFMIKDGKKDHPVKLLVIASNFFDLLMNVKELASDAKLTMSVACK
jgi:PmbA protein